MARVSAPTFVLGVVAVTIVASAVGLILTNVFEDSALVAFDIDLSNTLEASRTPLLTTLTGIGTFFADPLPVAGFWLLAVVVSAVLLRSWRPPMFFMIAIGGEKLSYLLTTLVVDRPRPEVETVGKVHVTSSYPSGHVGSAVSLWMALALLIMTVLSGRLDKRAVVVTTIVGVFFALEVGYSRLYRGHHFFTDVVAGALIGAVWVVIAYKFILAPYLRQRSEERRQSPPPAVPTNARVAS
ncbi:MAG TPA: phosphatase PAP2 family protein [Acidimicrobiales bacterium]|nr:phosphatase PAP2 family protein [Acidimicrobiales bacterium]